MDIVQAFLSPLQAVGNIIDELFLTKEEKLDKAVIMSRLRQKAQYAQAQINLVEAQSRTLFVAGWRPFIGWVCGVNLAYLLLIRDWLVWLIVVFKLPLPAPPALGVDMTLEIVLALLGLGTLRTFEKLYGRTR